MLPAPLAPPCRRCARSALVSGSGACKRSAGSSVMCHGRGCGMVALPCPALHFVAPYAAACRQHEIAMHACMVALRFAVQACRRACQSQSRRWPAAMPWWRSTAGTGGWGQAPAVGGEHTRLHCRGLFCWGYQSFPAAVTACPCSGSARGATCCTLALPHLTLPSPPVPTCSWASDSAFVKDVVEEFRKEHDLLKKPLFFTGCSCAHWGGALGCGAEVCHRVCLFQPQPALVLLCHCQEQRVGQGFGRSMLNCLGAHMSLLRSSALAVWAAGLPHMPDMALSTYAFYAMLNCWPCPALLCWVQRAARWRCGCPA